MHISIAGYHRRPDAAEWNYQTKELRRQTTTQFSSLSPPFFHVHPPREDKRLYRVRMRKKEILRGSVYPLIFSSDFRGPLAAYLRPGPPKLQNTLLCLPFIPPLLTKMQLAARDSILDPLHGTWSWSSFTAVIDLTVSFEGLA